MLKYVSIGVLYVQHNKGMKRKAKKINCNENSVDGKKKYLANKRGNLLQYFSVNSMLVFLR